MPRQRSFLPRFSICAVALAGGLTVIANSAVAQTPAAPPAAESTPPGSKPAPAETDIGRVSTGAGQGENGPTPVVPSATINRADAIAEKQQAPNLIDVQPLSEIIKLPDINTAEALQRIPGISLETDSGEGRFVHIRGLDSDLNGTTYGGVRLPASNPSSPSGGGRAVAFDTFPTGVIGGVELTKTSRPDMDAEALGGSINLVPRSGAEHGGAPFIDADLGSGYEPLRESPVYHAEVSAGRSFDGGDGIGGLFAGKNAFSAVVTAVYHEDKRGIDDVEESYTDQQSSGYPDKVLSNLQFRRYEYHRRRYGAAANFDAKASDSTSLYLRVLYSGYLEGADKHYLVLNNLDDSSQGGCTPLPSCIQDPGNPNGFIASGAQLQQQTTDTLERIQNGLGVVGGSSIFSNFKLDYHASFALGTDRVSTSYGSVWTDPNPVPIAYDTTTDPRYPRFHTLDGTNPANPANYALQEIDLGPSYAHDGETAAALDATIPTGSGDHAGEWKFGLSLRDRHKTSVASSPVFTPTGTIALLPATYGSPQIYYNNLYDIGPAISLPSVRTLANSNLGTMTDDAAADAASNTDDRENVFAGYGQYSARLGKVGVLAGVRVESTRATYGGNLYNSDADTNTPTTERNSYTNYFPTLQGRYDFFENLVGRLTYSTGIARPGFEQITPGASISVSNAAVTVGNPALKPTLGQNFDATVEYYPGDGQVAALGLFYKQFRDYILLSQQIVSGYNYPGLTGVITTVQSYTNGPAHAEGVEGQYQQQFKFLPAPFDGFGYSGNFTLVDSRAQIHPGIYGLLPSTSKVTWNAAVFYERAPFEVRVAADYVGQDLFAFGGTIGNAADVYSRHRLTLDLGSSYAIAHEVKIYFDAKNLLNTPLEFTEGTSDSRPIQREFYDITLLAGVRMSF
ncbi:MAG: TonB-dependent receptor [Steroidobacteraceae bacterium]